MARPGRKRYRPGYCGARGRITLEEVAQLDSKKWAVQPKLDGTYCEITTDGTGRVKSVITRTGRRLGAKLHEFDDEVIGPPESVLIGELSVWTQGAYRLEEQLGYTLCELFDCRRLLGDDVSERPYRERRARLWRAQVDLEAQGIPRRAWVADADGRRHDPESGQFVENNQVVINWGRTPIVEQVPPSKAADIWRRIGLSPWVEGIVAVKLDSRLGAQGAKLKCKPLYTRDCAVISASAGYVRLEWPYAATGTTALGARGARWRNLQPGEVVELGYESFTDQMHPRFPRLLRRGRPDLADLEPPSAPPFELVDLSGE